MTSPSPSRSGSPVTRPPPRPSARGSSNKCEEESGGGAEREGEGRHVSPRSLLPLGQRRRAPLCPIGRERGWGGVSWASSVRKNLECCSLFVFVISTSETGRHKLFQRDFDHFCVICVFFQGQSRMKARAQRNGCFVQARIIKSQTPMGTNV